MIKNTDKAYVAGLIDGEGSIFICKQKRWKNGSFGYQLRVMVGMTDKKTIDFLKNKLGGGIHCVKGRKVNHSDCYLWGIYAKNASNLLKTLKPYLITKKEEAEIAIEFQGKCYFSKPIKKIKVEEMLKIREEYYNRLNKTKRLKNHQWISKIKNDKDKKSFYGY